jgi:hypothetical protein
MVGDEDRSPLVPSVRTLSIGAGDRARPGAAPVDTLPEGAEIGRYVVEEVLGEGGMGVVYAARDVKLDRRVALKVLRPGSGGQAADVQGQVRLLREAQALAKLAHPNAVHVYDVGSHREQVYIAMELVPGSTLRRWLQLESRSWREILDMFAQAGRGLAAAHAAGLVHRDFKPDNVLVGSDGRARVVDFGVARMSALADERGPTVAAADPPRGGGLTRTDVVLGTPSYMAPEQARGVSTASSDQFSFCVSLYEALHGALPAATPSAEAERARVPRWVDAVVARGMRPDPAERFPSMEALLSALGRHPVARWWWRIGPAVVVVAAIAAIGLAARPPRSSAARAALDRIRPLTHTGACAYSPTFAGNGQIVFDLTRGNAIDLYALSGDREPRQITDAPGTEWRASPGRRAGEILYLTIDPGEKDMAKAGHAAFRDLETGAEEIAVPTMTPGAVVAGDAVYYVRADQHELRRRTAGTDVAVLSSTSDLPLSVLSASADGRWLGVLRRANQAVTQVCIVDLAAAEPALDCPRTTRAMGGRVAFAVDSPGFYFAGVDGIRRFDIERREEQMIAAGAMAVGGVAISPDGNRLVYSDCTAKGAIVAVSSPGHAVLVTEPNAKALTAGPDGLLAWVRTTPVDKVLVVRRPDGSLVELTPRSLPVASGLAFDPAGKRIAFSAADPRAGIHVVELDAGYGPAQVTGGRDDRNPVWLADGRIAFMRGDDLYSVQPDGTDERRLALDRPRLLKDVDRATGELLVSSADQAHLYFLDLATGRERPVAQGALAETRSASARLSPDGHWLLLQGGAFYGHVIKMALDDPAGAVVPVYDAGAGETLESAAILSDGTVVANPASWKGEIIEIPARSGMRF